MAEVTTNITDINEVIIPLIIEAFQEQLSWIPALVQAVGILFIIYAIYIIISTILQYKSRSRVKRIEMKLDEIDKKIIRLLKHKKK